MAEAQEAPPETAGASAEDLVKVFVVLHPDGHAIEIDAHKEDLIGQIKELAAGELQVPPQQLFVQSRQGNQLDERLQISQALAPEHMDESGRLVLVLSQLRETLGYGPETVHEDAGEEAAHQGGPAAPPAGEYKMPDVLEVSLPGSDDPTAPPEERQPRKVLVQIVREDLTKRKPFLGGFRNKKTGTTSHHASTQTMRKSRKQAVEKFERETQTQRWATRSQQTQRESGTQMDRPDLLLSKDHDRVIVSRPYFTADELEDVKQVKARDIQCFLRQCFAWRRVRRLRESKLEEEAELIRKREAEMLQQEEEHKKQIQRRMHPRTAQDFELLHRELEVWRAHETARIKSSGEPEERIQAQLRDLLHKQVKLLQTIDRLKIEAAKENKAIKTQTTLEKMASPKEWTVTSGEKVEVETPFTQRARELVELYSGLCLPGLATEQRIDVLLHVKYTVKEFPCELTDDILELIQREQDLLRRGRSEQSLSGLRKRLSHLFLRFLDTPQFNPEASNFRKIPALPVDIHQKPSKRSRVLRASEASDTGSLTAATPSSDVPAEEEDDGGADAAAATDGADDY